MGLSLRNIGRKISDIAGGVERQINPFDNGQTFKNPQGNAPQQQAQGIQAPSAFYQATHNGLTNVAGGLGRGLVEGPIKAFNAVSATPVGTFMPGGRPQDQIENFASKLPESARADFRNQAYSNLLKESGFNNNDSAATVARKFVGNAAQIPLVAVAPELKGASLATQVGKSAALGGAFGVSQQATTDQATPLDLLKAGAESAAITGAFPIAGAAAKPVVKLAGKAVENRAPLLAPQEGSVSIPSGTSQFNTLQKLQDKEASRYKTSAPVKLKNKVLESVYDPRAVEQSLDNQRFAQLKQVGATTKGQSELLPNESLALLRGRIQNPYTAASVRDKTKFTTDIGDFSVKDIIKKYGKENSPQARNFESYRIYKDELERLSKGEAPTTPISPKEMQSFVSNYEKQNPDAVYHNQALRAKALQDTVDLEQHGVLPAGTADKLSQYQFYTPRKMQAPEDTARIKVSGGIRSGQKGVQSRKQFNEAPTSPLSVFKEGSVTAERDIANQLYGKELVKRINEGALPGGRIAVNAEDVIARKKLIDNAKMFMDSVKKASVKASNTRADLRSSNILKGGAEYNASQKAKKALLSIIKDSDAKSAIRDMNRKDLVTVFKELVNEGTPNLERARVRLVKNSKQNQKLVDELNNLKQQIQGDKEQAAALRQEAYSLNNKASKNTQSFQYRVNGTVGKIDLPGQLAESLSKQNEVNVETIIGKNLRGVSNAQKAVWTGILQPSFKLWNTLVKNPLLMFVNADGLSGIRPEVVGSFARQLVNTEKMAAFKTEMQKRGVAYENAFQSVNINKDVADDIAARANLISFFNRNPARTLKDVVKGLNSAFASVDNAQRNAVAYGAFRRAKELGFNDNQALEIASQAPGKVFGDFNRITQLAQAMEPLIPYTGATQAGTRALIRSAKTRPVETAVKATVLGSGMAAFANYSIQNANEYYKDMQEQGKTYFLDNNIVIALPGAHKNPEDGKWSGIISVPLLPDIRPMNRAIWRTVYSNANDGSVNPAMIAAEAFNQSTGDIANQVYDKQKAKAGNPLTGVLPGSPVVNLLKTAGGINTYSGGQLANEYQQTLPRTEQANKNTSKGAKSISNLTKGVVTPLQVDQILAQIGTTGDIIQSPEDTKTTFVKGLTKPLQPGKSQTEQQKSGTAYFKDFESVAKSAKNEKDYREFVARHQKSDGSSLLNSAERSMVYLNQPNQYELDKTLDSKARKRGETGNPLFDLTPEQTQKVLTYRSGKIYNAAGQNKDKNGASAFTALGLDEPWYQNFINNESKYYSNLASKNDGEQAKTFSGAVKPQPSPELQKKLDYYYKLGKGTGQRSAFLKVNPDILDYWAKSNDFSNTEREALGFKPVDNQTSNGFGGSGGGYNRYGRKKSNPTANPEKYAVSRKGRYKASPKVSVKTVKLRSSGSAKTAQASKPKVSIKKSLV